MAEAASRDVSLYALGGLAVLGMVFSGNLGLGGALPAWIYHALASGFTFNRPATLNGAAVTRPTTPTQPRQMLGTYIVPAGGSTYLGATTLANIRSPAVTRSQQPA